MVTGIIAELNPIHEGHERLIKSIKDKHHEKDDAIIMILSGDFVQRGEPAICDKFIRTRKALNAGVDLVIEMPVSFSLSSAEGFARSGIGLLEQTGVVDEVTFGVEELYNAEKFGQLVQALIDEDYDYRMILKNALKDGMNYAAARQKALTDVYPDIPASYYTTPNNILALEYGKALAHFDSDIKMNPVLREGDFSAHAIREEMLANKKKGIFIDDFTQAFGVRHWGKQKDYGDDVFKRFLHLYSYDKQLSDLIDVMENKSVTRTRISRMLFRYMLGLPNSDNYDTIDQYAPYLRVLGFKRDSDWLLREVHDNAKAPIIQKIADDTEDFNYFQQGLLNEDLMAHELYRLISIQKYPYDQIKDDYTQGMIII